MEENHTVCTPPTRALVDKLIILVNAGSDVNIIKANVSWNGLIVQEDGVTCPKGMSGEITRVITVEFQVVHSKFSIGITEC